MTKREHLREYLSASAFELMTKRIIRATDSPLAIAAALTKQFTTDVWADIKFVVAELGRHVGGTGVRMVERAAKERVDDPAVGKMIEGAADMAAGWLSGLGKKKK